MLSVFDADTRAMLTVIASNFTERVAHLGTFVLPTWVSVRAAAALGREPRPISPEREIMQVIFILYLVVVAAATIVPLQPIAVSGVGSLSFVPGRSTIGCYLQMKGTPVEMVICSMQLLGNVLLFVPLGLLLPIVLKSVSVRAVAGWAFFLSVTIEVIQYLQRFMGMKRSADVDDVILNVVGALIGYVLIKLWMTSTARGGAYRPGD
jgi:glycopeptide antibiotics resistance protein